LKKDTIEDVSKSMHKIRCGECPSSTRKNVLLDYFLRTFVCKDLSKFRGCFASHLSENPLEPQISANLSPNEEGLILNVQKR